MTKLGKQASQPNISGIAYKYKPIRHSRLPLSGDSDSAPLNLTSTGVLVHQCVDYASDEVYLWVSNHNNTNNRTLTLEIGGDGSFSDPNLTILLEVDRLTGLIQVYPGIPHQNISIYAKADADNVLNLFGYVDRHYRLDITDESLGYDGGDSGAI